MHNAYFEYDDPMPPVMRRREGDVVGLPTQKNVGCGPGLSLRGDVSIRSLPVLLPEDEIAAEG